MQRQFEGNANIGEFATAHTFLAAPLLLIVLSGSPFHILRQSGTQDSKSSTSIELSTQVRNCSGLVGWKTSILLLADTLLTQTLSSLSAAECRDGQSCRYFSAQAPYREDP
jgi:hypothetical protein